MRIGILSRGRLNYSTRRLGRAANRRGHRVTLMDPFDCTMFVAAGRPRILHRGRSVEGLHVLIPRLSSATARYGLEVIAHFEWVGVPSVNPAEAIATARNKWRALRALSEAGVPVPASFAAGSTEGLERAVARIGGYPFLIKPFEGTQGNGLILLETATTAALTLDTLWNLRQDYVAQRFYAESAGSDVRVLVVGDRVLGAMQRVAAPGEFRANFHRGGLGRAIPIEEEIAELAVRAARAVGLGVAGVDLLLTHEGPVVLEVNPSPGFEGFEQATGADVADAIVAYAERIARTPS
ncbi:MAG: putative alpha-L-glutamate ligase [Candidatus Poribacteria bacterium]|nr:MAG: putative alpha-L-glutamate ligase [Candidatus Poribacteria bacterium]